MASFLRYERVSASSRSSSSSWRLLEAADLVEDLGAVPLHGIGVALGVLVLTVGERRLGHERPQPGVVGGLGEVPELLLGHGQLLAELLEARADLGEAALDEGPGHRGSVRPTGARPGSATMLRWPGTLRRAPLGRRGARGRSASARAAADPATTGACGPTTRESLDPAYLVHVLGDADDLEYTSDPPTSGPHQPGPAVTGVVDGAAAPARCRSGSSSEATSSSSTTPTSTTGQRADLEALADDRVVVAPNPDLPAPGRGDGLALQAHVPDASTSEPSQDFVDERVGNGPEG